MTIRYEFKYDGGGLGKGGTGTIFVNGEKVAEGRIERTQADRLLGRRRRRRRPGRRDAGDRRLQGRRQQVHRQDQQGDHRAEELGSELQIALQPQDKECRRWPRCVHRFRRDCWVRTSRGAQTDPLPSWNEGPTQAGDSRVRRRGHQGRRAGLRPAGRADRHVRQRRHALVRTAGGATRFRRRPAQAADRQEAGVAATSRRSRRPSRATWRTSRRKASTAIAEARLPHARGDDGGRVRRAGREVLQDGQASQVRGATQGSHVPADARAARLSCGTTGSRRTSAPAAGSSSCGPCPRRSTASRRSR